MDHLLLSNRSHVYCASEDFPAALKDAEEVIRLRPDWPKVTIKYLLILLTSSGRFHPLYWVDLIRL